MTAASPNKPSRLRGEAREIAIGAAAFGCLALVFVYLYGGRDVAAAIDGTEVVAKFNRVDGLVTGDEVHMGGIRIGTIERMTLDDQYRAVVTMRIRPDVKLPKDTSAAVHTDGLFGAKFIILEPGGEVEFMRPGDEITYTQGSVVVSDLLDLIISEGRAAMTRRAADATDK